MATKKSVKTKKYFTAAQANASLPLIRAIVTDITELARALRERHDLMMRAAPSDRGVLGDAYREELQHVQQQFDRDQERMKEFEEELKKLGVELKDYYTGLIDFPCWMDQREVLLCWRLGEPQVSHWHEVDSGFAGRQKLKVEPTDN